MTQKTKIFYLTTSARVGGTEKQLLYLAEAMHKKEDYEVVVGTVMAERKDPLLKELRKQDIKTYSLELENKYEFWKIFKFYKILKKENPDILQSFLYFDNLAARVFGKLAYLRRGRGRQARVPVIISGHRSVYNKRSFLRRFLDKATVGFADLIIANTQAGKGTLAKEINISRDKIKVIYNGIESTNYKLLVTNDKSSVISHQSLVVGFVGTIIDYKGVRELYEAAKILLQENKNFEFIFVGDGALREELENKAKQNNLSENIKFLGEQKNTDKYIGEFDILVLPSHREGMPNVVMEAMLQDVPVVASNVGGVPELVEDGKTGFLTESKNSQALAEKINYVLNLPQEQKEKITNAAKQKIQTEFTLEKMIQQYSNLYENTIHNN